MALQYPPMLASLNTLSRPLPIALRLAVLSTLLLIGCETAQGPSLDTAMAEYNRRQYNSAYARAKQVMDTSTGSTEDQARLIAGMSAYRLGNKATARSLLQPLRFNSDAHTAGTANATLGIMHKEDGNNASAESHLLRAIDNLSGNDRAQAHYHVASVYQKMGRWADAQKHLRLCAALATMTSLKVAAEQQISTTGYTLQLGAYADRSNAEDRARKLSVTCTRAGLGTPRVLQSSTPSGGTLYLVQVGRFSTFSAAMTSRRKLTDSNVSITTIKQDY